jgi:hypothetical protein
MLSNNIDIYKAATLLISAPILKVCASGNACQVAICGRAIKFECSTRLPASSTQQSNKNDVGNGDGNKVAVNSKSDGKGGNGNCDGDEGGGQAMATTWEMTTAMRVAGNKEGDAKDGKGKGGGDKDKVGRGNGDNMGDGNGNEGGGQEGNGKEKGKGGKGNGDGNEGGRQATVTTWAMMMAPKRAIMRASRAIAMAMMMAGNKDGDGKGGKGNGDGNYNGGQQRGGC